VAGLPSSPEALAVGRMPRGKNGSLDKFSIGQKVRFSSDAPTLLAEMASSAPNSEQPTCGGSLRGLWVTNSAKAF